MKREIKHRGTETLRKKDNLFFFNSGNYCFVFYLCASVPRWLIYIGSGFYRLGNQNGNGQKQTAV